MGLNAPLDCIFPDLLLPGYDPILGDNGYPQTFNSANIPCLPPETEAEDIHELRRIPCPWKVTTRHMDDFHASLQAFKTQIPEYSPPSALGISRHITGYFEDFHNHLPFLHTATYRPQDCPHAPELVLAIAAIGAICKYERHAALQHYQAAKVIVHARWTQHQRSRDGDGSLRLSPWNELRTIQAALLLSAFAIMEVKIEATENVASLHCLLVDYVEHETDGDSINAEHMNWSEWIFWESKQRTKCAIFNVLNMHAVTLDSCPVLPENRLNTFLPCSTLEWTAQNETAWREAAQSAPAVVHFHEAYSNLFSVSQPRTDLHSPFGNLVLMNALLQRIQLMRQMQLDTKSPTLRATDLDEIEVALERWTHAWQQAPESILDPRNPDASNSFTSTSLLGLAFVRLYTPYASCRRLCEWQPEKTGHLLSRAQDPQRTTRITPALLHATQAFAIPVKFGMESTSRRQFHHWDLQNFLWHLEAAVFLSKWLSDAAGASPDEPLSEFESRMTSIIRSLIDKAEESTGQGHTLRSDAIINGRNPALGRDLSARLTRLWASLYKKHSSPWGLTDLIGASLDKYERAMKGR